MTMTFHSYKRNDSALNFPYRPSRLTEKYCKRLYLEQLMEAKFNHESTNLTLNGHFQNIIHNLRYLQYINTHIEYLMILQVSYSTQHPLPISL